VCARFLGEVVLAAGAGRMTGSLRGTMRVERIQLAVQGRQTELFVHEHPDADELLRGQGIHAAQGLDALDDHDWAGDPADERYPAAMFGET
jgi:hypothetical protein